jgi:hypothetical protein
VKIATPMLAPLLSTVYICYTELCAPHFRSVSMMQITSRPFGIDTIDTGINQGVLAMVQTFWLVLLASVES